MCICLFPTLLELYGVYRDDGKRPDGVTLSPSFKGKCLLWDATYADTLVKNHISSNSRSAGAAAFITAETRKDFQTLERRRLSAWTFEHKEA